MGSTRLTEAPGRMGRSLLGNVVTLTAFNVALAGCTRYVEVESSPGLQAYYRTNFPARDVSGALEDAMASVVRVFVSRSYETYLFAEDRAPTEADVRAWGSDVRGLARDTIASREGTESTGVVIASRSSVLTILTTDHGVSFPDTVVNYFEDGAESEPRPGWERVIERITIKTRQDNSVTGAYYVDPFEILARDPARDLALLGVRFEEDVNPGARPPSRLLAGDPGRLSLGSLVYVIGYPAGFQMVTQGIVSDRDRGSNDSFLLDGLWNQGMSGAPILSVRGEGDALEWVGIARAAAARTEDRLVAPEGVELVQDPLTPYEGPVYLQPVQEIRYGVTFSVPMTEIRSFLAEHRSRLSSLGYPLPAL